MLRSVAPEDRFVIYRMVLSDRQEPDGFHLNGDGELDPDGKQRLDYVGVCEVEAWVPMKKVRLVPQGSKLVVSIPAIQLHPVVNYQLSFAWKESSRIPPGAVPKVMEAIRSRATAQAVQRNVIANAQESAQRWFEAFLGAFGYDVTVRFDG